MNIEWINTNGLNQEANIYEMCLLKKENDNYIPITVACMCKDYFQDSFFMARMKNNLNPSSNKWVLTSISNLLEIFSFRNLL